MAKVIHLYCRHCGETLGNQGWPYCQPCNLELAYKAMPILLGMLLTSQAKPGEKWPHLPHTSEPVDQVVDPFEDEDCIVVPYRPITPRSHIVSAYLDEPCIMVAY